MSASSDEDDDEDEADPGRRSNRGARPDLACLRQLSAQLLRCRACSAVALVPVEYLQGLLKALDALLLRGRDTVLHRKEQVRTWRIGLMQRVGCRLRRESKHALLHAVPGMSNNRSLRTLHGSIFLWLGL